MSKKQTLSKAIFLDRDGVINFEQGWVYKLKDFKIIEGVIESLKLYQKKKYLLIVITNQSGIGLGLYKHDDVNKIHQYLIKELKKQNITITEIYYCPHHPDNCNCLCRKPGTILLEKAIARFNIDVKKSYFIGDRERDIEAGKKCGIKTILIPSNSSMKRIAYKIP